MTEKVVGISFVDSNKIYYFLPNNLELGKGDDVIVETERGEQFGTVVTDLISVNPEKLVTSLKLVIRKATVADKKTNDKMLMMR